MEKVWDTLGFHRKEEREGASWILDEEIFDVLGGRDTWDPVKMEG